MLQGSMMLNKIKLFQVAMLGLVLLASGCGTPLPSIVPASVTVKTADGEPVGNVLVRFVPQVEGVDGNFIATGVTDKQGKCELKFPGKEQSCCCACSHKVLVVEGPLPDEVRNNYERSRGKSVVKFQETLKHRPLPENFSRLGTTPLVFEVTKDQLEYPIELP